MTKYIGFKIEAQITCIVSARIGRSLSKALGRKTSSWIYLLSQTGNPEEPGTLWTSSTEKPFTKAEKEKVEAFFWGFFAKDNFQPLISWITVDNS